MTYDLLFGFRTFYKFLFTLSCFRVGDLLVGVE